MTSVGPLERGPEGEFYLEVHNDLSPGSTCPSCSRRIPHPKKSTSPTTRPLAYRVPEDEYEAHLETIDAVADLLGIKVKKYHRYNTVNAGMLALLQGARLEEDGG